MFDQRSLIQLGRGVLVGATLRSNPENPSTPLSYPDDWLYEALGAIRTDSGVRVTATAAMTLSAFYACVRIIAETVASLPLFPFRRLPVRGRERAADHPTYRVLHDQANPLMTSLVFREALMAQTLVHGNGYAEIVRNGAGEIAELWPLPSTAVHPRILDSRTLFYEINTSQGIIALAAEDMLHLPGLGFDGIIGLSPVRMARQAIGMGLAADAFGASFFGNAMRPSGIVESPAGAHQTPEQINDTAKSLQALYAGPKKAGCIAMLLGWLTWKALTIPPDDAQFLQTRSFQVREMGRIFRVPGHLLGEDDKVATYASVEQFNLIFVTHTIRPWLVRWEQELNRKLFSASEQKVFFAEHVIDGLLRGDAKGRADAQAVQWQHGALSIDEWREMENRNPLAGGKGDNFFVPMNFTKLDDKLAAPAPAIGQQQATPILAATFAALFRDADGRWSAREQKNRTTEAARKIYLPLFIALATVIRGAALEPAQAELLRLSCQAYVPVGETAATLIQKFCEVYSHEATAA